MDRSTYEHMQETLKKIYDKLEDSFTMTFSDEEINELKEKMEHLESRLMQMEELNSILCDVHNEIVDLQDLLAAHEPEEEEKNESTDSQDSGLEKVSIPTPESSEATLDASSSDSCESKSREKLPFSFLRSISNSAYTRYYTAYKEAKTLLKQLNKDPIFQFAEQRIKMLVPDAKTLYASLKEVYDELDNLELSKKYGKNFVRFHKIFKKMLRIAETYAIKQQK